LFIYLFKYDDERAAPRSFAHQLHSTASMSFQQPTPFTINVDDSLLKLTKQKLQEARFPDEFENVGLPINIIEAHISNFVDGTPLNEVKRLLDHWLNKYDWANT
jgi:Epoxide hydrolase N terminus